MNLLDVVPTERKHFFRLPTLCNRFMQNKDIYILRRHPLVDRLGPKINVLQVSFRDDQESAATNKSEKTDM